MNLVLQNLFELSATSFEHYLKLSVTAALEPKSNAIKLTPYPMEIPQDQERDRHFCSWSGSCSPIGICH